MYTSGPDADGISVQPWVVLSDFVDQTAESRVLLSDW